MGKLAGVAVAAIALIVAGITEAWLLEAFNLSGRPDWLGRSVFWTVVVVGVILGVRLSFWIEEHRKSPSSGGDRTATVRTHSPAGSRKRR